MKPLLFCLAGCFLFMGMAQGAGLVLELKDATNADGAVTMIVAKASDGKIAATTFTYQGVVRSICHNQEETIYAVNLKSGAEMSEPVIFILDPGKGIKILPHFSDQMKARIDLHGDSLTTDYLSVYKISHRRLFVRAGTKGEPTYSFAVEINPQGQPEIDQKSVETESQGR